MATSSKATLNPALKDFWLAKKTPDGKPVRNRILYGGRSSSKTWDIGGFAIFLACNFQLRFLCTRQLQNRIDESVHALLKIQITRFGLDDQFEVTNNKIENLITGTVFVFYGIRHHIKQIKGFEGADVLWIEEGEDLSKEQWEILEPTIRKEGSQVWMGFNPHLVSDFAYSYFVRNPPPGTILRKINYDENPFLSQTMLDIIEAAKERDYDEFCHIYLGEPLLNDDAVVIKRAWLLAAVDAHVKLGFEALGKKRIGFDVADSGADKCANVFAHGSVVSWADQWKGQEDELFKSCTRTWNSARQHSASVTYDSIGVGAGCGSNFTVLNDAIIDGKIQYQKFNAGGAVEKPEGWYSVEAKIKNKDHFSNIKAQAWWMVADRFRNTYNAIHKGQKFDEDQLISLSSKTPLLNLLIDELSTPKRDFDNNGKVKVESKKDLDKREVPSPNLADALIMCFAPGQEQIVFSNSFMNELAMMGRTR